MAKATKRTAARRKTPHPVGKRFGRAIRGLRKTLTDLSQDRFAGEARINRTYYSDLERGMINPTVDMLDRVIRALGCDYATLGAAVDAER